MRSSILAGGVQVLLLALAALAAGPDQPAPRPSVVKGLELSEPSVRTRPGVAKVVAKVAAEKDQTVEIVWDVEATFEDADVEFDWEVRDGGMAVQVVIPDSRGLIKISAVAIVAGKPTDKKMAKTAITVDYRPRTPAPPAPPVDVSPPEPKAQPPAPAPAPATPEAKKGPAEKGKVVRVILVCDFAAGDANVNAMATAVRTRNELRKRGVAVEVVEAAGDKLEKLGLTKILDGAGGAPAAVWVTDADRVRKVSKPSTLESLLAEAPE